jgi:hypothetical protein
MMGLPLGQDISIIFNNIKSVIEMMKSQVDKTESDL